MDLGKYSNSCRSSMSDLLVYLSVSLTVWVRRYTLHIVQVLQCTLPYPKAWKFQKHNMVWWLVTLRLSFLNIMNWSSSLSFFDIMRVIKIKSYYFLQTIQNPYPAYNCYALTDLSQSLLIFPTEANALSERIWTPCTRQGHRRARAKGSRKIFSIGDYYEICACLSVKRYMMNAKDENGNCVRCRFYWSFYMEAAV